MIKYIAATALLLLASVNTLAAFIYADDFTVGEDVSHLTDNATLSWISGTGNFSSSSVFSPVGFFHQHFGGTENATTYDTIPGLLEEALGSPAQYDYAALEINFISAIRSFGFKAENRTSSPFGVFLYDSEGSLIQYMIASVVNTGVPSPGHYGSIFDATYHWNFDFDVSKIRIGGASDGGYIYALDVSQVAEPSSVALLIIGLLGLIIARRSALKPIN